MNNKEFMNQRVKGMTISELARAIEIKNKEINAIVFKDKETKDLTIEEEFLRYPGRFERLIEEGFIVATNDMGKINVLNKTWNYAPFDNKLFYVELLDSPKNHKEIIRRRQ